MADVLKLQSTVGMFDYPDPANPSKGTTEQQYIEFEKNKHSVLSSLVTDELWQPSTVYSVGQVVKSPNMPANVVARAVTAGMSAAAEPVWSSAGHTMADGSVVWAMLYRTIDYATQEEVTEGTNTTKIVTPAMLGKTIRTDLASENAGTLNAADKTVVGGVTGILPVSHGGTGLDHLPYTPNANNGVWDGTHFPAIGCDGVIEIGRIVDFHERSGDTDDYSVRLTSSGGKLFVNDTDIMSYIANVQSQAGVVAGNVSNANAWWVKLGGTIPLIIQGGYKYVGIRTDVYVPFPIAYSTVLSIVGTPVVNAENSSGRGLENIKTYNTTSFIYFSGYDINYKNLLWLSVGI